MSSHNDTIRDQFTKQAIPCKSKYFPQLSLKQAAASNSITALLSVLETHTIVMPEFAVFRERLSEALRAVNVAVNDFSQTVWRDP